MKKLSRSQWDVEVVNLLTKIHEHKGKQELFLEQKPAVLDKLVEIAKVQSVEDSNKIEGIITTTTRIKELMAQKTTPRNRDEEEILGYRDVLNTIHEVMSIFLSIVIIFYNSTENCINIVKRNWRKI